MERLIRKYAEKLIRAKLGEESGPSQPLVGGLDDVLVWNREAPECDVLEKVFQKMSMNSLVFLRPAEPYKTVIRHLAEQALDSGGRILPRDCETRTFLHDLPVIDTFSPEAIIEILKQRKSVIISCAGEEEIGPAVVAHGSVSPEQGFVTVSSVCFAAFVAFFSDYLEALQTKQVQPAHHAVFDRVLPFLEPSRPLSCEWISFPFADEKTVYSAIVQAGKAVVEHGLVDSYFGNVSYLWQNTLYISQTGSSLDELEHCIDPVPLDFSTSAGLTASSELSAHLETVSRTGCRAILHGHPRFCVILSMDCDPARKAVCAFRDQCHLRCPDKRFAGTTPIVPGEVGTGPTGLCHTLPAALETVDNAIVYGHGLFATAQQDFSQAFSVLLSVEQACQARYLEKVSDLRQTY